MPRTARSYDSAFASDADEQPKKASSICELSSYEKLNSGQTKGGKSDASSGDSSGASSPSSSSSSDGSTAPSSIQVSNKNRLSLGGAGRHTKRLVDMKTAAAVASVHKSGSVGAKKVAAAAAAAAASTAKKKRGRRSTSGSIGSAKKKGSTEKKKPAAAVAAAAAKKRKKKQSSSSSAAAKPASVAMPGRLVRISDYHRRMEPSPISSPIHRLNLTFTPEAVEADKQKKKEDESQKATATAGAAVATASKKRSATMVSGGTGRFNIKQE